MDLAEVVGQLSQLRRFPVEELEGESPSVAAVDGQGLVGHHAFRLLDDAGQPPGDRAIPLLRSYSARYLDNMVPGSLASWARVRGPDGREFAVLDPVWTSELSARLGRMLTLHSRIGGEPVLLPLVSRASLRLTQRAYGKTLESSLLRAVLVVDIPEGKAFAEDSWIGHRLRIGDVLLAVEGASVDAVVPAEIPDAGDLGMVRGLLHVRRGTLGVAARVISGLRLRAGDSVLLVD